MDAKTQDAAGPELREGERAPHINAATFERTDTGIRVCFGHHARSEDCEWEEYVPTAPRETALAAPRVQDDSLRAAAQGMWDAFKDFERYPRTVDGDRLNALAALRAALDKPPAAPTGETAPTNAQRLAVARQYGIEAEDSPEHGGIMYNASDEDIERLVDALAARVPAPSAPQEPRGEPSEGMGRAVRLIVDERERQKSVEGWTEQHDDDEHTGGELAKAAACYALAPHPVLVGDVRNGQGVPLGWPWMRRHWKPTPNDRIRELVKAGALIVAEIERLQRAAQSTGGRDAD